MPLLRHRKPRSLVSHLRRTDINIGVHQSGTYRTGLNMTPDHSHVTTGSRLTLKSFLVQVSLMEKQFLGVRRHRIQGELAMEAVDKPPIVFTFRCGVHAEIFYMKSYLRFIMCIVLPTYALTFSPISGMVYYIKKIKTVQLLRNS